MFFFEKQWKMIKQFCFSNDQTISVHFNWFSKEEICIRENKLKGDPAPEVGGPDFLSFLIAFPKKKFVLGKTK